MFLFFFLTRILSDFLTKYLYEDVNLLCGSFINVFLWLIDQNVKDDLSGQKEMTEFHYEMEKRSFFL